MSRKFELRSPALTIVFALIIALAFGTPKAAAQADPYPKMAPIEQYMMDKDAEIQLARTAAPDSISHDATVLILGRQGYETAVEGKNGFVCWVSRSWMAAFDWDEFWNPKVRAADCMNPQAARAIVPVVLLRSRMAMAGRSKAEMLTAIKTAYEKKELPELESGAMDYMMSKPSYLTDQGEHNLPHLMFFTSGVDAKDWGSGAAGAPVMAAPYWFFLSTDPSQVKGLPPILVFLVGVADWSDGTPARKHGDM
jgi:hypothetical protein